jgi:hypothetical protein
MAMITTPPNMAASVPPAGDGGLSDMFAVIAMTSVKPASL